MVEARPEPDLNQIENPIRRERSKSKKKRRRPRSASAALMNAIHMSKKKMTRFLIETGADQRKIQRWRSSEVKDW